MTRQGRGLIGAGLLALLLALWMTTPPRARPATAPADAFSAARAMADVRRFGAGPHVAGTAADARVAAGLRARLTELGLRTAIEPVPLDDRSRARLGGWLHRPVPPATATVNVIGILPGRDPRQPALLLMAHHDTVAGSPGAADDTAGVAAILEIMRALRAGPAPARDVLALFTGGEELGLTGARAFFRASPLAPHVGMVVNFDTRGGGGRALMFETGQGNGEDVAALARAARWPFASSLAVSIYRLLPNATDFTPALVAGRRGFNFAFIGRARLYHSPLATPGRVDEGAVQDFGDQGLALARALARAPALPAPAADHAFSDLFGTVLVHYPLPVGWLLLALAALGAGLAAVRRRSRLRLRGLLLGLVLGPAILVGGGALLFLFNRLSGAGVSAEYYDRLAAIPRLEAQAALVALSALLAIGGWWRWDRWESWLGLFIFTWIGGVALQAALPGAATLVHWSLLTASAAMMATGRSGRRWPVALIGGAMAGQLLGYAHFLFGGIGAPRAEVMALPLLLAALPLWPLLAGWARPRAALAGAAGLLLVACALALWVRLDPVAPSVPVYVSDKR